ncbi:Protein FAM179A, partial [Buceros rhinoceros silvestris]
RGFFIIRCLIVFHLEVLLCRLHDVSLAVSKEVNNLHLKVSQLAMGTLAELCRTLKKHMDHEVNEIAQVLLQKTGDSHEFVQKAANQSLGVVVGSVSPARAMTALMASGVRHRNVLVRKCAAEHLATTMERTGAKKLLSGKSNSVKLLVCTVVKLAQDSHPDTRCYGRKMLSILMNQQKCHRYLEQFVSPHDLQDIMRRIKQMGREDSKCEPPSAKDPRKSRNSDLVTPSDGSLRSGSAVLTLPRQTVCRTSPQTVEEPEQLDELYKLLTAKEFQTRMEGVVLLLDYCKSSPQLISTNIVQIFKFFALRLQDCNKKVKEKALEVLTLMMPMLRGGFHPVLVSLVAAVTENLNSKHTEIYTAAVKVLEASIAHI